jgi:hypothetical protein
MSMVLTHWKTKSTWTWNVLAFSSWYSNAMKDWDPVLAILWSKLSISILSNCRCRQVCSTPMFVERNIRYWALFTNLVGWHAGTVSFPLSDVILAQLACPLSDVMFWLHSGITNLSVYKHCSTYRYLRERYWSRHISLQKYTSTKQEH